MTARSNAYNNGGDIDATDALAATSGREIKRRGRQMWDRGGYRGPTGKAKAGEVFLLQVTSNLIFPSGITTNGTGARMRIVVSSFVIAAWSLCLVESVFLVPGGRGYRIPLTDSVPFGLYKVTDEPVSRGLFVAECLPLDMATFATERGYLQEGSCPGKVMPLLKEVVAVEGDEVDLTWAYVAVNGHVIFSSETRIIDSKGRAVPAFRRGKFRLKPGEVPLVRTE